MRKPSTGDVEPTAYHGSAEINFIFSLPVSAEGYDMAMPVACNYTKRVTTVSGKSTWSAWEWNKALLDQLCLVDWGLMKMILFDRDRNFIGELWREMFELLGVNSLYSSAYHPQTDGQSERTNQTVTAATSSPRDWLGTPSGGTSRTLTASFLRISGLHY